MMLFSLRFALLYAVLLVPWATLNESASAYLRTLGELVYGGTDDRRELDFEPLTTPEHPFGLRIVIVNRSLMHDDGSGPVRNLDLDARGLISRPLALTFALILCTPISWKRRLSAAFWCVLWEHVIVLLVLGFCIWNESVEISLSQITPFGKEIAGSLREILVVQLGLGVPILLWIAVVFRRSDSRLASALTLFPVKAAQP